MHDSYVISLKEYRKMRKRKRATVEGLALRGILFLTSITIMIVLMIGVAHV